MGNASERSDRRIPPDRGTRLLRTALSLLAVAATSTAVGAGVYRAEHRNEPSTAQSPAAHGQRLTASPAPASPDFDSALGGYLSGTGVRLSVLAVDDRTGTSVDYQATGIYQTASIVKVDILATLLLQNGGTLNDTDQDLVDQMITESDNNSATTLWDQVGGAPAIAAANQRFGLTHTVPGSDDYWGETTTTVGDQVRLLDEVLDPAGPLGAAGAAEVAHEMSQVEDDQAWGVSAAAASGDTTALKNGWMPGGADTDDSTWTINTIGRVQGSHDELTMAVLSDTDPSEQSGINAVEHAATLARHYLEPG